MSQTPHTDEIELLLSCSRVRLEPVDVERIRSLLQKNLNWDYLLDTARRNAVVPLLYSNLQKLAPVAIPNVILEQLQHQFLLGAAYNLMCTNQLFKLVKLLEAHDISPIPFKGPVLADTVYGNIALREFRDLDILVREQDFEKARQLLISQGYEPVSPYQIGPETKGQDLLNRKYNILVDLIYRVAEETYSFPIDHESLWSHAMSISLNDNRVLHFTAEDLLLLLSMHGCKHAWAKLKWVCDINELLQVNPSLNWADVVSHAQALHSERTLLVTVAIAHDLLGTPLPEIILQRIRTDKTVGQLVTWARKRILQQSKSEFNRRFQNFTFYLRTRQRQRDKFGLYKYLITPNEKDLAFVKFPKSLSFLYYLVRPIRIFLEYR